MRLPAYQIYNVLRQYSRRLNRSRWSKGRLDPDGAGEERSFPAAVRRREVVGQVMEVIRQNVGRLRATVQKDGKGQNPVQDDSAGRAAADNGKFPPFVYNLIDKNHRKITRTISVEAPGLLSQDDSGRRNPSEG